MLGSLEPREPELQQLGYFSLFGQSSLIYISRASGATRCWHSVKNSMREKCKHLPPANCSISTFILLFLWIMCLQLLYCYYCSLTECNYSVYIQSCTYPFLGHFCSDVSQKEETKNILSLPAYEFLRRRGQSRFRNFVCGRHTNVNLLLTHQSTFLFCFSLLAS